MSASFTGKRFHAYKYAVKYNKVIGVWCESDKKN